MAQNNLNDSGSSWNLEVYVQTLTGTYRKRTSRYPDIFSLTLYDMPYFCRICDWTKVADSR